MLRPERASAKGSSRDSAGADKPQRDTSKPEPIVPERSIAGSALMLVIAIMGCLACLSVGAVTLVDRAASEWSADIGRELTIEVSAIDPAIMEERLERAADLARVSPGIGTVSVVSEAETRALLEPWLGVSGFRSGLGRASHSAPGRDARHRRQRAQSHHIAGRTRPGGAGRNGG
jgi:hypothetical protein